MLFSNNDTLFLTKDFSMKMQYRYHASLFLSLIITIPAAGMDLADKSQLSLVEYRPTIKGELFIDHLKIDLNDTVVKYLTKNDRASHPYATKFNDLPEATPFVHVKIKTNSPFLKPEIFTVMPASLLVNYNTGSVMNFKTDKLIFRLTCAENEELILDKEYLPQDMIDNKKNNFINTFKAQFLACMNMFYDKKIYSKNPLNIKSLLENNILQESKSSMYFLDSNEVCRQYMEIFCYSHGPNGCKTHHDLMALAYQQTNNACSEPKKDRIGNECIIL